MKISWRLLQLECVSELEGRRKIPPSTSLCTGTWAILYTGCTQAQQFLTSLLWYFEKLFSIELRCASKDIYQGTKPWRLQQAYLWTVLLQCRQESAIQASAISSGTAGDQLLRLGGQQPEDMPQIYAAHKILCHGNALLQHERISWSLNMAPEGFLIEQLGLDWMLELAFTPITSSSAQGKKIACEICSDETSLCLYPLLWLRYHIWRRVRATADLAAGSSTHKIKSIDNHRSIASDLCLIGWIHLFAKRRKPFYNLLKRESDQLGNTGCLSSDYNNHRSIAV